MGILKNGTSDNMNFTNTPIVFIYHMILPHTILELIINLKWYLKCMFDIIMSDHKLFESRLNEIYP